MQCRVFWLVVLLTACTPVPAPAAGAAPCVLLVDEAAPVYCRPERIERDVLAALDWYRQQAQQIAATASYPPAMLHEAGTYYDGPLLHETREALYQQQQMGRVVYAEWDTLRVVAGPVWDDSGQTATIFVQVSGYRQTTQPPRAATPQLPLAGSTTQDWRFTLRYDAAADRWKIWEAASLAPS
ncbi:MAG: hypothetical protein HC876_22250 [Chloroflexaceae bacterium]|nr:hypothetical protein [Chloroflexaceae bacterium]